MKVKFAVCLTAINVFTTVCAYRRGDEVTMMIGILATILCLLASYTSHLRAVEEAEHEKSVFDKMKDL